MEVPSSIRDALPPEVTAVQVDGELLLLDAAGARIVRLDASAMAGAAEGSSEVLAALGSLGLRRNVERRAVLSGAALAALGISVMALPSATAAASPDLGLTSGGAAGILDTTFTPNPASTLRCLALQADGAIILGGLFQNVGGVTRNRIARVDDAGEVDPDFDPDVGGTVARVDAVAVDTFQRTVLVGPFTTVDGQTRNRAARIAADGTLESFDPNLNGDAYSLAIDSDGRILIGGAFTQVRSSFPARVSNRLARVLPNGAPDTSFANPNVSSDVYAIAVQGNNGIILGGSFTSVGGQTRNRLARVHANGALDTDFDPNVNGNVSTLLIDSNDRIILGGSFSSVGGQTRNRIARIHANGALDTSFDPSANGDVRSMAIDPDGRIILGGLFTNIAGQARGRLARLSESGALDSSFTASADNFVGAIVVDPDGRIVIGGSFTRIDGTTALRMARLI